MLGPNNTQLAHELTNIQLECGVIHSPELADEASSNYKNGKRFVYEHVTHLKTVSVNKGLDTIINESINVPRRSMEGLVLLFNEAYVAGAHDSEKTFNPDVTEVKVIVNGIPNKVHRNEDKKIVGRGVQEIWRGKKRDECNRLLCWRQIHSSSISGV